MFLFSSVLLATGLLLANAQTQEATIYEVTASLPSTSDFGGFSQSVSFSPVATGTDGVTTYIEELVDSFSGSMPPPDLSGPVTYDFVFAESSAGYRASAFIPDSTGTPSQSLPTPAFVDTCTFVDYAPQGKGVCVQVLGDDRFGPGSASESESESFFTLTFTGSVVPAFTYHEAVVSTSSASGAPASGSTSGYGPGWPWPTSGYGSGYGPGPYGDKKKKSSAGAIAGGVVGGLVGVAVLLGAWVVWLRRRRRRAWAGPGLTSGLDEEETTRQVAQLPGTGPSVVAAAAIPPAAPAAPEAAASEESTSGVAASTRKLSPLHRTTVTTPTITNSSGPSLTGTSSPVQASGNATPETDGALAEQVRVMAERMAVMEAQLRMRGADGDSESVVDRPPRYSTTV